MNLIKNHHHLLFSARKLLFIGSATLLLFLSLFFVSGAYADDPSASNDQRLVTIHDGGSEVTLVTRALTIKDALKQAKISLGTADIVEPALSETLVAKTYQVNIFRARPVVIDDGVTAIRVMTAEQSPKQIAKVAEMPLYDEDIAQLERVDDVLVDGGAGLKLKIDRATVFSFALYGKTFEARTQATSVAELMKEKGIVLGANDGVSPASGTIISAGMTVKIWRDGKQTVTQEESIARSTEEIKDTAQALGYRQIKTLGVDGKRNVTYEIETKDGVEVGRKEIASVTILEPIKEVIVVGAKYLGAYTTPGENETITWNFLIAQGFTREQTAGIMGNLMQEHHFNTTDTAGGLGIAQWTGGRRLNLMNQPDYLNIHTQLNYLMSELNGGYVGAKNAILASTSVEGAVVAFQNKFERCGVCMEGTRIQFAYDILSSH